MRAGRSSAQLVAAICAVAGSALLLVGTYLHPMSADPNDALAAFTEYAADGLWVASHLTQLAGVVLMMGALVAIGHLVEPQIGAVAARMAGAAATGTAAIAAALQAVDGVALNRMVRVWAAADGATQAMRFEAAFAVRQIEIGLAAMLSLAAGVTAMLYGFLLRTVDAYPRWLSALGLIGGAALLGSGVAMAYTGFSDLEMAINMPASVGLLLWMASLGWRTWRADLSPIVVPSRSPSAASTDG